jgi:hypothetical protein
MGAGKKNDKIDRWDQLNQKIKDHEYLVKVIIAIFGIFATILAAFFGAYFAITAADKQINDQKQQEQKNLATGFLIELEQNEKYLTTLSVDFKNRSSARYNPTKIIEPLYPDYGLFYSKGSDISKFNPNLSRKLFKFYSTLLEAESDRTLFNLYYYETDANKIKENPKLSLDPNVMEAMALKQPAYDKMKNNVIKCADDIEDIKNGLNSYIKD